MALVKATQAQPDTVLIPTQDLHARVGFIAKNKGSACLPGLLQVVGDILRQCIDATSHIHRLARQPNMLWR